MLILSVTAAPGDSLICGHCEPSLIRKHLAGRGPSEEREGRAAIDGPVSKTSRMVERWGARLPALVTQKGGTRGQAGRH